MTDRRLAPVVPPGSRYVDQRPYVAASSPAELRGPTHGHVMLDERMDWSGQPSYDLDDERELAEMYETVLREASTADDLARWLDGTTFVRLWPRLVLPPQVRRVWESRFSELAISRSRATR